jgi:hypothetical protein
MSPLYDEAIGRYLFVLGKVLLTGALDPRTSGRTAFDQVFGRTSGSDASSAAP